ncbi:MAG TPA: anthranilate phosphoribosyltransferase [Candidatus Saccharimonadales bacterium]|nr:anthranilate phosphoribosyltransferase [Candidatus Saccharimonadales bacterium]
MDAAKILNKLMQKQDLTQTESEFFLSGVIEGSISQVQTGAILVALQMKGETVSEIVSFIKVMRGRMVKVVSVDAIDVCGTGGDGSSSFNISTAVSFVVAGAGVKVAKHGNRAASSKCGAADVLEKLDVNINLSSVQAAEVLKSTGMVFLFAPLFHPATKNVIAVRKELKVRTVFNFLGPFLNPVSVKRQLIGVPNIEIAKKLIQVGKELSYEHLWIVTSRDGMDEISVSAKTDVFELKNGKIKQFVIDPQDFGIKKSSKKEIEEGTLSENAEFIRDIFNGVKNAKRDIVVLNSAAALYVAGKAKDIREGIEMAEESIENGKAKKILENMIKETQRYV